MIRSLFSKLPVLAGLFLTLSLGACGTTLTVAPHAELKDLDPTWTTAYIVRNHGYMVYDTLFALDQGFEPQPQMVKSWNVSKDEKTWTFTLRDGLKWHDDKPVTAEDCVASLKRWGQRDGHGQRLMANTESLKAVDDKTFVWKLKYGNGRVHHTLAKMSSNVPFMMPKRIAETDPFTPITDPVGSGPYKLKKSAWEDGKVVYEKNEDYVPRNEPQSMAAGGKVPVADKIVWQFFKNQEDAVKALKSGKIDYMESPSTRLVPELREAEHVVVNSTDPLGNMAMLRFNAQQVPFDKVGVRRAVLMAISQKDYMDAALGDPLFWRECYSVYPCGTPLSNENGSDVLKVGSIEKARAALKQAGYDGTPVVILNPVDSPVISALTGVTASKLKKLGMKVVVEDMTWAELIERRTNRASVKDGGWSMFHTWWLAADVMDPLAIAYSGNPKTGWPGWIDDAKLEQYRDAFAMAETEEARKGIAVKAQGRLLELGAVGVLGQFFEPVAYRDNVSGITSPVQFYWSMSVE